jgi:NAD(P)H-flavin reductase
MSPHRLDEHGFFSARARAVWRESARFVGIKLEVGGGLGAMYKVPGQVVKVRSPRSGESYFALAAAPAPDGSLELLARSDASILAPLGIDDGTGAPPDPGRLEVTAPFGRGFPVGEAEGRDVLLVAQGSGIAPIRALLQHLLTDRARTGRLVLVYGQREPDDFAYRAEHVAWRAAGVELCLCASQPGEGWSGASGRVQDAVASVTATLDPARTVAFLCGTSEMVADVRRLLNGIGVPLERTHLNF